jgi:hypothetical protein
MPDSIAAVERAIRENRWVTIDEMAAELKVSHGSAHHIVHDMLQYHKVSARWLPKQLTLEMKERRVDVCQTLLRRYEPKESAQCLMTKVGTTTSSQRLSELARSGAETKEVPCSSISWKINAHPLLGL